MKALEQYFHMVLFIMFTRWLLKRFRPMPYSKEIIVTPGTIIQPSERRRSKNVSKFVIAKKSYLKAKMPGSRFFLGI